MQNGNETWGGKIHMSENLHLGRKSFELNLTHLLRFEWPQDQEVNYLASSLEVTLWYLNSETFWRKICLLRLAIEIWCWESKKKRNAGLWAERRRAKTHILHFYSKLKVLLLGCVLEKERIWRGFEIDSFLIQ